MGKIKITKLLHFLLETLYALKSWNTWLYAKFIIFSFPHCLETMYFLLKLAGFG